MESQFSPDGKYFAQISADGKLKIWNTLSNSFVHEFTPDFHLISPCTCLHFIISNLECKTGSPRKKKRRDSQCESSANIAVGTSSGRLLIYSLIKGDLDYEIDSATSQSLNCISANDDQYVYSGTDNSVLVWDLHKRNINSKWAAGNDKINAILIIPDSTRLLTASKNIKLWDIQSKEVLKMYTGHSSQIALLHYISPRDSTADAYVISGSKGDRLLNCWNLNNADGKNPAASFLMEDIVHNLSININHDGTTNMAATVRSGVVHIYQHTLNGSRSTKPLKPKTTVQVVSDEEDCVPVSPIHIIAAVHRDAQTLCICYGNAVIHTFENITISSYQKLQCLLRKDLRRAVVSKDNQVSKTRTAVVGNDVHYLTTQTSNNVSTKRKNDGQQELPMEKRLENLMVNDLDTTSKVPKANNVAQLLVQGLHSKDKNILKAALFKKDEQLIKNTVKRLSMPVIVPLFEELTTLIQGKTLSRRIGLMWLKSLILVHSALLLSNPDLPKLFTDFLGSIEVGIALQTPRNKLMGRLELLLSQISQVSAPETQDNCEALLVFNDKASSDSDNDDMEFDVHSSSENEWEEASNDSQEKNGKHIESEYENESEGEPMSA